PLHEALKALPELVDDLLLAGLAGRELDGRLVGQDAELLGAGDGAEDAGRLEVLLGRDAAAVEAGAAHLVLLDDGDAQAGAGAVERGGIAAGAAADDDDVELLGRGDHLLEDGSKPMAPDRRCFEGEDLRDRRDDVAGADGVPRL